MKKIFALFAVMGATIQWVSAATILSAGAGVHPLSGPGINYVNFDSSTADTTGAYSENGLDVFIEPNGKYATGSVDGEYAEPQPSNGNDTYFSSGLPNNYLTSGIETENGSITLTFPSATNYVGLLWGSIDDYNTLTFVFKDGTTQSFTGADVYTPATGNQGPEGSPYVNFISDKYITSIIATSAQYAFEIDNVAYGHVPEGGATLSLLGLALTGMAVVRKVKSRK